jgi:hypothetical protein
MKSVQNLRFSLIEICLSKTYLCEILVTQRGVAGFEKRRETPISRKRSSFKSFSQSIQAEKLRGRK